MCKVNLFLRIFTTLILSVLIVFLDNYYLFWLLLFYMLFLSIVDRNYKSLLVNFAVVLILLFCYYSKKVRILLKILYIINLLLILFFSFTKRERKYFNYRYNKKRRKKLFYEENLQKVIDENTSKAVPIYGENVLLNSKVNKDMDQLYLYGKVRFYGYGTKITNFANCRWSIYDSMFALVVLVVLLLLFIYW